MNRQILTALNLCILTAFAGCGGGGGSSETTQPPAGPSAEGAYSGSATGGTSTAFQLVVLENGDYWSLYGRNSGSVFLVSGFLQGQGTSSNPNFTSSNTRDFGVSPPATGSINATYVTGTSISGNGTAAGQTFTFSGQSIPATTYDYNTPASLTSIVGSWSLTALNGAAVSMAIANTGSFTASTSGCNFSGTVTPRPSGKNIFNVALTFGPAPCALPNQAASGIAISNLLANGNRQLIIAGTDTARNNGTVLFGLR